MGAEKGERGGVDWLGGALGFGAAVDGEEVDAGVLDGLDEVYGLAGFVSTSPLFVDLWKPCGSFGMSVP